jgi:uncharacterized membrane protein YraQ (UPF0718 family)
MPDAVPQRAGRGRQKVFDGTFFSMLVVLIALVALAWHRGGSDLALAGLGSGAGLLVRFTAVLVLAFLIAGLAEKLVPYDWVRGALGPDSGMRGLLIAVAAGMVTPSGPFISFPIAATLLKSGASTAAVVTYIAAWMLLAVHRFFIWELPFLGLPTALARWVVCLALPVLAGLATRAVLR